MPVQAQRGWPRSRRFGAVGVLIGRWFVGCEAQSDDRRVRHEAAVRQDLDRAVGVAPPRGEDQGVVRPVGGDFGWNHQQAQALPVRSGQMQDVLVLRPESLQSQGLAVHDELLWRGVPRFDRVCHLGDLVQPDGQYVHECR